MTALATAADTANAPVPFAFESHQIRTVINGDGIPWFVAKDTAAALGLAWHGKILDNIPETWRSMRKLLTPRMKAGKMIAETKQRTIVISEPAVYKLAFRSNKPEADRFTNWVASEVIPALRRQGKYELCPSPETPRLTTAKERNALTTLINRYVGLLPGGPNQEAYKSAWRKVHDVMGIKGIEELTVEQLPRAVVFVQSLIDALVLPKGEEQKALPVVIPPLSTIRDYAAIFQSLPKDMRYWRDLTNRLSDASDRFRAELRAIEKDAMRPFKEDRRVGIATFLDCATIDSYKQLFRIAEQGQQTAFMGVYGALSGLENLHDLLLRG